MFSSSACFYVGNANRKSPFLTRPYLTVVHRTHWKLEAAWEAGASLFCFPPTQHQ